MTKTIEELNVELAAAKAEARTSARAKVKAAAKAEVKAAVEAWDRVERIEAEIAELEQDNEF